MLIIAIVLVCLAHFIRTLRWELFVKTYEKPNTKNLLQSLSIGYFINSFIPFKAGDLVRAWISGRKMKNGRGFALATVIVDRYLDILVVGILFAIFSAFNLDSADSVWFYMFLAVGVLAVTLLVYILRGYVKRILKNIAGIFNARIEIRLLRFFWSLIWSFKDIFKKISKTQLLLETLGMWILYLTSYYCFAAFLSHQGSNMNWLALERFQHLLLLSLKEIIIVFRVERVCLTFDLLVRGIMYIRQPFKGQVVHFLALGFIFPCKRPFTPPNFMPIFVCNPRLAFLWMAT